MNVRFPRLFALLLVGAASCGSSVRSTPVVPAQVTPEETAPATATPTATPTPPRLRLPQHVKPTRVAAKLRIVPGEDELEGTIDIDVVVSEPTGVIWLNADDITVDEASVTAGGRTLAAQAFVPERSFLALILPEPIGPGAAQLHLEYRGRLNKTDRDGAFTQKEGDHWYVFTQFEALDARRALPCFDEPSFKVPWQLTLVVRPEDEALANTPAESTTVESGWKEVRFAETRPLPSYLVAFAVGPFEFVDAGRNANGTPIRIVTPRGRAADARYAAESTLPILQLMEAYFGSPYPYEKLDFIAVPQYGPGAMENPGLVTFRQELLLARPEETTRRFQRRFALIAAHELAHQWFGNLVTLAWWDDIWLNEAFASWMEDKIIHEWKPEWEILASMAGQKSGIIGNDSLATARRVRHPIESENDIANAFDGITYGKGAAVIAMFEQWIGAETFQKGVRHYLAKHAHSTATSTDFLAALGEVAGRDLATPFGTYLEQVGAPLVSFEMACKKGEKPRLALAQRRFLPQGSTADAEKVWQVPVCVRWAAGRAEGRDCTLLADATGEMTLEKAPACPDWVMPNADAAGYYVSLPKGDLLDRLLKKGVKALSLPERVNLISDLEALVDGGAVPIAQTLGLVETMAKDPSRHIMSASLGIVGGLDEMIPAELRPNYQRFVRKLYGKKARELGWAARAGEDDDATFLRPSVLGIVAVQGEDPELVAKARELAWKWLDDRKVVEPDLVGTVLGIASRHGDRTLWERFLEEAKKATDRKERGRFLGALGAFSAPELVKASLALVLTDDFSTIEAMSILWATLQHPASRPLAYEFVKTNFDALVAKLPRDYGAYLPYVAVGFCDEAHRADAEAFFRERSTKFTGGPRILDQALEQMALCARSREAQRPGVIAFLEKY